MSSCQFPYTGPKCQTTYADKIGRDYYLYNGIFIGGSILTLVFTSIQFFRVWLFTDPRKYQINQRISGLSWLASIFLAIQSIDPAGYRAILDPIIEVLSAEFCAICCLIIVFVLIMRFINVSHPEGGWQTRFWLVLSVITVVISIVFSFLQVYVNRSTFRGLKLIIYGFVLAAATFKVDYLIYQLLEEQITQQRHLFRLKVFLGIYNSFVLFVFFYQLISGSITIDRQTSLQPEIHPDSIVYPLCELVGILLATAFMSKIDYTDLYNTTHGRYYIWLEKFLEYQEERATQRATQRTTEQPSRQS